MQVVPGTGTAVPTSDPASNNNPPAATKQYRYSSRSNSFSSASVVTIKRTGSLSSTSTGARNSALPIRAQSPADTSLIALRVGREPFPQDHAHKRRKSFALEPSERADGNALVASHSHSSSSTSNSNTAPTTRTRSRASSGALQPGAVHATASPKKRPVGTIDYSPRASVHRPNLSRSSSYVHSPGSSPERERRRPSRPELTNPLNNLPSLHATPALTDPNDVDSPATTLTITTPSTQASYRPDYFYDDGSSPYGYAKVQPTAIIRSLPDVFSSADSTAATSTEHTAKVDPLQPQPAAHISTNPTGDNRRRDRSNEASKAATTENGRHRSSKPRDKGEKEKKAMLSKALAKANTAVQLDNAQNFEGAMVAYTDACALLQQVMDRSSGADDRRKLDAIRSTYTSRIEELQQMEVPQDELSREKSLPARPMSSDSHSATPALASPAVDSAMGYPDTTPLTTSTAVFENGLSIRGAQTDVLSSLGSDPQPGISQASELHASERPTDLPPRLPPLPSGSSSPWLQDAAFDEREAIVPSSLKPAALRIEPHTAVDIPAPLSPTKGNSPKRKAETQTPYQTEQPRTDIEKLIDGDQNTGQNLWLDTIDEGRSSRASSVHSVSSQQGLRRKYLRTVSGVSNPDFDAAFDAAVEAAYDQGLEPDLEGARSQQESLSRRAPNDSVVVRSSQIAEISDSVQRSFGDPILAVDEEEERILDDIARTYERAFNFDVSSKSALPRQSDSSGYSRSTWQSSQTSERATAGTSLTTVAEDAPTTSSPKNAFATSASMNSLLAERPPSHPPPPAPPPQTSLPRLPTAPANRQAGVRSRRLSGQDMKQLKIETPGKPDLRQRASTFHHSSSPFKEDEEQRAELDQNFKFGGSYEPLTASDTAHSDFLKSPPSLELRSTVSDTSRPHTATTMDHRESLDDVPGELLSHKPTLIKKTKSSVSLREHMVLLASPTVENGPSLITPLSSTFMNFASKRRNETPLTSQRATRPTFGGSAAEGSVAGVLLFDTSLTSPGLPASPKTSVTPAAVEPCPESFLLRPFWLMRNVLSTLTHPRGAFLTSRLFVPREVWETRGVKLKCIEDKIANCDLLTAALGRLAGVDTFDADAVVEELQIFEDVMERVQTTLTKKLGSEVSAGGLPSMFKDAPSNAPTATGSSADAAAAGQTKSKDGGNSGAKGYLSSWRKLRSKSSGAPIVTGSHAGRAATVAALKPSNEQDAFNLASVPMTTWISVERRGHSKRDVRNMVFEGEHKHYMSSLASLFEGVQVLDQIARQVEDPGLRAVSSTHVGMELSIRHAAEFFGFYVCRFVLADLGMMLDKFVKRGSEWVLA